MKIIFKIGLVVLVLLSFRLDAQQGYYGKLTYRYNDPFLFCTKGQDRKMNPAPCWIPMYPYTGNFMLMPYCRPPNPYGKDWSQDDTKSYQEYLTTCPQAMSSGRWKGPGQAETSPFQH